MAKKIYKDKPNSYVNQRLANLQIMAQDKNDLYKYKKIYSISKAWIYLKSYFFMSQQLMSSIEAKISPIDNGRQQFFTLGPANIIFDFANDFGSIFPIC